MVYAVPVALISRIIPLPAGGSRNWREPPG